MQRITAEHSSWETWEKDKRVLGPSGPIEQPHVGIESQRLLITTNGHDAKRGQSKKARDKRGQRENKGNSCE